MWCEKCNYGSATMKHNGVNFKCPQCGNTTIEYSNPIPKKPERSIRDMKKRTKMEVDKRTKKVVSTEVKEAIKEAGSLK